MSYYVRSIYLVSGNKSADRPPVTSKTDTKIKGTAQWISTSNPKVKFAVTVAIRPIEL